MKTARCVGFLCVLATSVLAWAAPPVQITGGRCRVAFSPVDGSIVGINEAGHDAAIAAGGEFGLWQIRFADGTELNSSAWKEPGGDRHFDLRRVSNDRIRMSFTSADVEVIVIVNSLADGVEFLGQVKPARKTVLDFSMPARLRFSPGRVSRFVTPLTGHTGVGAAFNGRFFSEQSPERPSAWQPESVGPKGYAALFGAGLKSLDYTAPPVPLTVTEDGRKWLPGWLVQRLGKATARVSRPSQPSQVQLTLVDSASGAYVGASNLGGSGRLWRLGGPVFQEQARDALDIVGAIIDKLAMDAPARKKLALVNMVNGPTQGGGASVSVHEWEDRINKAIAHANAKGRGLEFVELTTPQEMLAAAGTDDYLLILNPYGEWLPVPQGQTLPGVLPAIGRYVKQGGQWFEVGGYSFYAALRPSKYLKFQTPYPPAFADFQQLETNDGTLAVYRAQPCDWKPWAGATDAKSIFIPGHMAFGGDESGGYCERAYGTYVKPAQTWQAPPVRIVAGHSVVENLRAYASANGISRTLDQKMPPALLDKFKQAVLLKYEGNIQEKMAALEKLPVPTLIHISDYLKGGFDKEYPDHLPPRASMGSPLQFREFFDRSRAMGHLMMPYTNPTWWCDHPRGPTFEREGEAPLAVDLAGKHHYEKYSMNDGWTITMWHRAVQEANRKTLREFTADYPCDVLFQDQCGARTWVYDMNSASPAPYAYAEGLISLIEEQYTAKPLSTEEAFDRVLNAESQLCGMMAPLDTSRRAKSFPGPFKNRFHPSAWTIYPIAQILGHDKAAFCHHDLQAGVTNDASISWTLGLGFCMSYAVQARTLAETRQIEWLRWLDRIQKSICARYVGQPVIDFEHDRGPQPDTVDDGIIRATYGPVRLLANLGPNARKEREHQLAAGGFYASAKGMVAGHLASLASVDLGEEGISFVAEGDSARAELWIHSTANRDVAVELPAEMAADFALKIDGQEVAATRISAKLIRFHLPPRRGAEGSVAVVYHGTIAAK